MQRQAPDDERHRIARELHDNVAQSVLSVGMTIEVCRAELESMGGPAAEIAGRLATAKDLTRHAAEQLRASIYALTERPRSRRSRCPSCCSGCPRCTGPPTCMSR